MAGVKKKGRRSANRHCVDIGFRNRLDDSRLLLVIEKVYKKEFGYWARKYLLTSAPRPLTFRYPSNRRPLSVRFSMLFGPWQGNPDWDRPGSESQWSNRPGSSNQTHTVSC